MAEAYLDTHVVVWLYFGKLSGISDRAKDAIEHYDLLISPMVSLELQYLYEIKKISVSAPRILSTLENTIGLQMSTTSFGRVAASALNESWTRDPFDRLIVAQAKADSAHLISKDEQILKHYRRTIW